MTNIRNRSRTVALRFVSLLIILSSLILIYFRFRQVMQYIGDVPINRQNAAIRFLVFFLFYNTHCLLTHRIILRGAMRGEEKKNPRNKSLKLLTQQNLAASPNGARCIVASIQKECQQFPAFSLFMGTLPNICALLCENGN
jgi:hypothetical protein